MARDINRIGVVGLGTMGAGIAEVFARNGIEVIGVERDDDALAVGRGHIEHSTDRGVKRGKLSAEDQAALIGRISFTTRLADLADAQLVIEAIPERLELKRDMFGRLDSIVAP
ncbi:MAG: 3-hydroxyacyl-CoA dehydrogenase family protein, partial [Jiangellaceae bacterium]